MMKVVLVDIFIAKASFASILILKYENYFLYETRDVTTNFDLFIFERCL